MRICHLFFAIASLVISPFRSQAEDLYIKYDAQYMDKMVYMSGSSDTKANFVTYRLHQNKAEKLFFDIGIETPIIKQRLEGTPVACDRVKLYREDVSAINSGLKKVYICKKLDSGWAILPVGTAHYSYYENDFFVYTAPNYDFQLDFKSEYRGINLSYVDDNLKNAIYYISEEDVCTQTGFVFQSVPRELVTDQINLVFLPGLGLVKERSSISGDYELQSINGTPVCNFLNKPNAPGPSASVAIQATKDIEKVTDVPSSYNVVVGSKSITEAVAPATNLVGVDNFSEDGKITPVVRSKSLTNTAPAVVCDKPVGFGEHLVQEGEMLYTIARTYGVSMAELRQWNNLKSDDLEVCSVIKVIPTLPKAEKVVPQATAVVPADVPTSYNVRPTTTTKPAVASKAVAAPCDLIAATNEHVVVAGESLFGIAKKYKTTVANLKKWNNLNKDVIFPCTKLIVAEQKSEKIGAAAVPSAYNVKVGSKAVKQRDISEETGVHRVEEGETVASVAARAGLSEAEFRKLNYFTDDDIVTTGQVVRMTLAGEAATNTPNPEAVPVAYNAPAIKSKSVTQTASGTFYTVNKGDTLYAIAKKHKITVDALRSYNNLAVGDIIVPNQVLKVVGQ